MKNGKSQFDQCVAALTTPPSQDIAIELVMERRELISSIVNSEIHILAASYTHAVLRFTGCGELIQRGVVSGPVINSRSQPITEPLLFHPNRVRAGRS